MSVYKCLFIIPQLCVINREIKFYAFFVAVCHILDLRTFGGQLLAKITVGGKLYVFSALQQTFPAVQHVWFCWHWGLGRFPYAYILTQSLEQAKMDLSHGSQLQW